MSKKRILALALALVVVFSLGSTAFADSKKLINPNEEDSIIDLQQQGLQKTIIPHKEIITPRKVISSEEQAIVLPEVTTGIISKENISGFSTNSYGVGYPIGRLRLTESSSNGIIQQSSKVGAYVSIAGIALSFASGIPAMTVGTILSAVGLVASGNTEVKSITYISYKYYYKNGEARWSSDPNSDKYFHLTYKVGKRDTYKHILGAKKNSSGLWTTSTKDYLSAPAKSQPSTHYGYNASWLISQAETRLLAGDQYIEYGW